MSKDPFLKALKKRAKRGEIEEMHMISIFSTCKCEEPSDVLNDVCGACLLPIGYEEIPPKAMSTEPREFLVPSSWQVGGPKVESGDYVTVAKEDYQALEQKLAVAVEAISYIDWEMDSLVHAAVDHKGEINPDWLEKKVLELKAKTQEALALINPTPKKETSE